MTRVLVAGSSGQVGNAVIQLLSQNEKYEVLGLSHKDLDISSRTSTLNAIHEFKPNVVFNGAAMTNVDLCESEKDRAYAINSIGVRNLVAGCADVDAQLIHLSTDFVFDGEKKVPYTEFDAPNPQSIYALSKLGGDNEALRYEKATILRVAWVFGKTGHDFFAWVLNGVKDNSIKALIGDAISSPTYSKDIATVAQAIMGHKIYGLINVANSGEVSRLEMGQEILRRANINVELEPITQDSLNRPAKRPLYSALSCSTLEILTGIKMRSWQEALDEHYETFK